MDQKKVEADVEVTEDRTGDLSLGKPRTGQLSHNCSFELFFLSSNIANVSKFLWALDKWRRSSTVIGFEVFTR